MDQALGAVAEAMDRRGEKLDLRTFPEQERLEIEPSLSNLTSLESVTKEQMAKLFEQIDADEEQAGIRAEALRRSKVRQLSSGR